jgi:hypothetical protein
VRVEAHQGQLPVMPKTFLEEIVDGNDTAGDPLLAQYIIPVITAYGSAAYYDSVRNIHNVRTGAIEIALTPLLVNHASGKLHPCTGVVFSQEDANCILGFDPKLGDAIHTGPKILKRHAIPLNFRELDVTALRGIVAAHGGTVTHNQPELMEIVSAMKDIEDEYNPIIADTNNGLMLPKLILTKSNVKPQVEIAKLLELSEIKNDPGLYKFFQDIEELYNTDKVMEDMDLIASKSAVMTTEFVTFHFATLGHVGQVAADKKSVRDSKSKSKEQISTITLMLSKT